MKRVTFYLPLLLVALCACRPDMYNQPKAKPDSRSEFFSNGANVRIPPAHTVQLGSNQGNAPFYSGLTNETLVTRLPLKLTPELLQRGRERFDIYCVVCHGAAGEGDGEIVRRGFPAPPSYHTDRLRNAPIGHFFDVITHGYGAMPSYAWAVEPGDRWAIAAYIRTLQLSQNSKVNDLAPNDRRRLEEMP